MQYESLQKHMGRYHTRDGGSEGEGRGRGKEEGEGKVKGGSVTKAYGSGVF